MILSDKEIRKLSTEMTPPLIQPFSEENLQGASYDVSMSGDIVRFKGLGRAVDPQKDTNLSDMYEYRDAGERGYLLSPGEYVLVKLQETIELPNQLVAHFRPRTRFTRCGVVIADQHCNPTYNGVLSIGLFNAGVNPFILRPGLKIAQIVFEELMSTPTEDKLYKNKSNAAYSEEIDGVFRGSVFDEAGWTSALKEMYENMLHHLDGGKE